MSVSQSFKLAVKSLLTSKMRALLTMLGIIIGVAAVIIITSLGNGTRNYMNDQFEKLGSNLVQVQVWPRGEGGTRDIDADDLYDLAAKYSQYITGVSPYVSAQAKVRCGTEEFERTSIYGVSEAFYSQERQQLMTGGALEEGRFLHYIDVERRQNVCVIGSYLAQEAFQNNALGKSLSIGGVPYTVIGVLEEQADNAEGSADDQVFIPHENASRLGGGMYGMEMYMVTSTSRDSASTV